MTGFPQAPHGPVPATAVVVGEALIDLTPHTDPNSAEFTAIPGGAPANVSVALARLGVPTEFLGRLSTDQFGRLLTGHLIENRVGITHSVRTTRPTTVAVVHLSPDGSADYSFYVEGTADWQWRADEPPDLGPVDPALLVVGSLALTLEPGAAVLEDFVAAQRAAGHSLIAYDPNVRPRLAGTRADEVARIERQVPLAHVVKASSDDVAWLYPDQDRRDVARHWHELAGGWVAITCGADGAYAITPSGQEVTVAGRSVKVVDTIGAGDAFLAGLLAALPRYDLLAPTPAATLAGLDADAVARAMDDAVLVAALTCTRAGADPPTREELDREPA